MPNASARSPLFVEPSTPLKLALMFLPALLGFAPLVIVFGLDLGNGPMYAALGGAVMLSAGLDGLFYMLLYQQKQLNRLMQHLDAQSAAAHASEGGAQA